MSSILIIDDEMALIHPYVRELEDCGHSVTVVPSGDEGVHTAKSLQPDLVLLDVRMEPADGFETCVRLKASRRTQDIVVAMFTVEDDHSPDEARAYRVGAKEYWVKATPEELVRNVERILAGTP